MLLYMLALGHNKDPSQLQLQVAQMDLEDGISIKLPHTDYEVNR